MNLIKDIKLILDSPGLFDWAQIKCWNVYMKKSNKTQPSWIMDKEMIEDWFVELLKPLQCNNNEIHNIFQ